MNANLGTKEKGTNYFFAALDKEFDRLRCFLPELLIVSAEKNSGGHMMNECGFVSDSNSSKVAESSAATVSAVTKSEATIQPQQKAELSKSETCLEMARTGMVAGGQEDFCEFKDNLKQKLKDLYNAMGCGNLVQRQDLDKASIEVSQGMGSHLAQSGQETFCNDARSSYADRIEYYEKANKAFVMGKN